MLMAAFCASEVPGAVLCAFFLPDAMLLALTDIPAEHDAATPGCLPARRSHPTPACPDADEDIFLHAPPKTR
jgi:hypothetical protein